jgi:hypothetical protein
VSDLLPDTTYHYRLVATNNGGTTSGLDRSFATNALGEPSSGSLLPGFSLTGIASGGPSAASFPNLSGLSPTASPAGKSDATPKPLTRIQKLLKALKACETNQRKPKRAKCERSVRQKYGARAKRPRSK